LDRNYVVRGECREDVSEPKRLRVTLRYNIACDKSIHCVYSLFRRNLTVRIQSEGESVVGELRNVHMTCEMNWMGLKLSSDGLVNIY
jgi:hypothetical protein